MLIVHPLSRCDVCLDEYSFATPQHTPHAIPCGHVFCKPCLGRLSPLMCPLCRKSFRGTEIGRLIVDRVSPDENGLIPGTPRMRFSQTEMEEIELLQRLALASGEDTPEAELSEVIVEAELWLESRNPSTNRVLRRALTSLRRSKRKEAELVNQKRAYSNLKSSYRSLRHRSEHESDMAKAVEENLLAELQNNESQNRAKLEAAEREIANLNHELARITMRSRPSSPFDLNPLPPPPKPYADDLIPNLIDKGKGIDGQPNRRNNHDTDALSQPKGNDGEFGAGSATTEVPYVSRATSEDWQSWYPFYRESQVVAEPQDPSQSNGQNSRSLSVVPGAHPAQRVVPPLNVRKKTRDTADSSPERLDQTAFQPNVRSVGWGTETLTVAGLSTTDAGNSQANGVGNSNNSTNDDRRVNRSPYLTSQTSFADLLRRPTAAREYGLHYGDSGSDHLRTLLGLPQPTVDTNASRESQQHPHSLRPGGAVSATARGAASAGADTTQVSHSSLGSLGLGRFMNSSSATSQSHMNNESGLGLQIGGDRNVDARQSVFYVNDDTLDQSSSGDDDDDGDGEFFTPRASTSNALSFNTSAVRRSGSRSRSHSRAVHDSGAVTDVEGTRANARFATRPSHSRSVSHQLPVVGPSSSGDLLVSQRNGGSMIRATPSHPPVSGHRTTTGRRTSASDPPPPTVSFVPPIHHAQGHGSSNTSVTNLPQNTSASSLNRTLVFNISGSSVSGTISIAQQGASRSQRENTGGRPGTSGRHEYPQYWTTASFSARNIDSTARQR